MVDSRLSKEMNRVYSFRLKMLPIVSNYKLDQNISVPSLPFIHDPCL